METYKKLMGLAWNFGKYYFSNKFDTPDQYSDFIDYGNELLATVNKKTNEKEYDFLRKLLVAVNDYCEQVWYESHDITGRGC